MILVSSLSNLRTSFVVEPETAIGIRGSYTGFGHMKATLAERISVAVSERAPESQSDLAAMSA